MKKILSGKFLFTVAAAVVFMVTSINGTLPAEDVKLIIAVVVTFYFTKA